MDDYSYDGSSFDRGLADDRRAAVDRAVPLTTHDAAFKYLTERRGIPAEVALGCADLRYLSAPIPGRPRTEHALVALLRPAPDAAPTGVELSPVDILGAPLGKRIMWSFEEHGCGRAWFFAGGDGDTAITAEGYGLKPLALLATGVKGRVLGWGSRPWLASKQMPAGVRRLVIVPDHRPGEDERGEDGKPLADGHDRDYERGADHWLLQLGRGAVSLAPDPAAMGKDADEVLRAHGVEALRALVDQAVEVKLSLDGEARYCASVRDPLQRGKAIAKVAEDFQLRRQGLTQAFRAEVEKYLKQQATERAEAEEGEEDRPPLVEEVFPWAHPVNGAEVLDAVVVLIRQHLHMPIEHAHTTALWAAFTHCLDLHWFNPRLAITSPVRRCGKSTLIEILMRLVARAKSTSGVTPAVVFRMIEACRPTYLIDEADGYLPDNDELRSVLNSGHTRTAATVDRNVKDANGNWVPTSFSTWTPLAVAGIGRLPSTLDDRSVKIRLQRKPRSVKLKRFRADRVAKISELGQKLARFTLDKQITIREADIEPPEALHDRAADNWRPLLAIAHAAGGAWPERAAAAALRLEDLELAAEDLCVELLSDVRDVFDEEVDADRKVTLFSNELLTKLLAKTDRPWVEAGKGGRALSERGMADLLKSFGIRTHKNVRRGEVCRKGYQRAEFEEAFASYLSSTPPPFSDSKRSQGHNPANPRASEDFDGSHHGSRDGSRVRSRSNGTGAAEPGTDGEAGVTRPVTHPVTHDVTHRDGRKAAENLDCDPVTLSSGKMTPPKRKNTRVGNGAAADDGPCTVCGKPIEGLSVSTEAGPACFGCVAEPAPSKPRPKRSRIKRPD